jgi:hypothetical protein
LEQLSLAEVVGDDIGEFQDKLITLLESPTGRRLLSELSGKLESSENADKVMANFSAVVDLMTHDPVAEQRKAKNSANVASIVSVFGQGCSLGFLEDLLHIPKARIVAFRAATKKRGGVLPDFLMSSYPDDVKRTGLPDDVKTLIVEFFLSMTFILSGATRNTRNLGVSKAELERELFAVWPQLLRKLAGRREPVSVSGTLTRFQESLRLAVQSGGVADFCEKEEYKTRRAFADQQYARQLARKRGMHWVAPEPCTDANEFTKPRESDDRVWYRSTLLGLIPSTLARVIGDDTVRDVSVDHPLELSPQQALDFSSQLSGELKLGDKGFTLDSTQPPTIDNVLRQLGQILEVVDEVKVTDPRGNAPACPYLGDYHVPSMRSFWRVLKQSKIRYTRAIHAHECPLHTSGPLWLIQLDDVNKALAVLPAGQEMERVRLIGVQRRLQNQVARYNLHVKQYAAQRPFMKELEKRLKPGECILYRDFVNQYNGDGKKVNNLVLVVMWRDEVGGPLHVQKLSNLCSDAESRSCDAYYVADVMAFHLQRETGFLSRFHKIYQSGDHGPHFISRSTALNESRFHELYGVEIENHFLCSYHAYNRCDAAGVEGKRLAQRQANIGNGAVDASVLTQIINESDYHNHHAFTFDVINRSRGIIPDKDSLTAVPHLKRQCAWKYRHTPDTLGDCFTEGVLSYRELSPGDEAYTWVDLITRSKPAQLLCQPCSRRADRIVRHAEAGDCEHARKPISLAGAPDPARIVGEQLSTKKGKKPKKRRVAKAARASGQFPCPGRGCLKIYYNRRGDCNRHLREHHKTELESSAPEHRHMVEFPPAAKKSRKKRVAAAPAASRPVRQRKRRRQPAVAGRRQRAKVDYADAGAES